MTPMGPEHSPFEEFEPTRGRTLEAYEPFVGRECTDGLARLAEPLAGRRWVHVNSTLAGGGVAEMLSSVVPLARSLGIDARWIALRGEPDFFRVTKKFHNLLQGVEQPLSLAEIFENYLGSLERSVDGARVEGDLVVVHDPQPAGLLPRGVFLGNTLWRCHIDTSAPNAFLWRFLLPYVNHCAGAIFSMPEFAGPGLHVPLFRVAPCIDPCAEKNVQREDHEARSILDPLFTEHGIDPRRPILAAVSRYDIHKNQATILEAFRILRREHRTGPPPTLIFLGNTANDDPEGEWMLQALREDAGDDPDVHFWVNVADNDRVVGSLMRIARAFVHVSTREGFGLVVSEALWQGTPVVGSNVGGIRCQVVDGKTGYVVQPHDAATIAARLHRLLVDRKEAARLGAAGREHVRRHFLLPVLLERYLRLFTWYAGVTKVTPDFRINGRTYSETVHPLRPRFPAA